MPQEFYGESGRPVRQTAQEALDAANASGVDTTINFGGDIVTVHPGDDLHEVTKKAIESQRSR